MKAMLKTIKDNPLEFVTDAFLAVFILAFVVGLYSLVGEL